VARVKLSASPARSRGGRLSMGGSVGGDVTRCV
jgi:hypothetical protein